MSQPAAAGAVQAASPPTRPFATAASHALSILVLLGLSLATFSYERTLHPLYGFAATRFHLNKIVWLAVIAGMFTPTFKLSTSLFALGALLCAMPQTAYWAAVHSGRMHDPVWGPVITHVAVIGPVLYLGIAVVKQLQKGGDLSDSPLQAMSLPVFRMAIMTLQDLWPTIVTIREISERDLLLYLSCAALVTWTAYPFLPSVESIAGQPGAPAPKRSPTSGGANLLRIAVLPLLPYLFIYMESPTIPKPFVGPYLHPSAPLRVLSSVDSPWSSIVQVAEILPPTPAAIKAGNATEPHSFRYLRAGHSLLGGVWIGDRVLSADGTGPLGRDQHSTAIGDSIYGAFVTQEAARFVERPGATGEQNALFIGLGTGISTSAFIKHGISATIVEKDPAVYAAATEFFGLDIAEPEKVHLMDGRSFVIQTIVNASRTDEDSRPKRELFDYVIHDLFSGGGVPGHLFTVRFWEDLSKIIKPDAVVAVNFAGKLESDSARGIYLTLTKIFPQCRLFHDSLEQLSEEKLKSDFINWIFLCTPTSEPIVLRPAVESDFLHSFLRSRVLATISEREVSGELITAGIEAGDLSSDKYLLKDEANKLNDWQDAEALHHWKLMREVLPDLYWETY